MVARSIGKLTFAFVAALAVSQAHAEDVAGSADHPLVGRFAGSSIIAYKTAADDEAALLKAPHDYAALLDRNALSDRSGPEWLPLEGAVTRIRYEMPPGHSAREVEKSYAASLAAAGFKTLFTCAGAACFTGNLTDDYLLGQQLDTDNSDTTRYGTHMRYLLAARGEPDGGGNAAPPVYVALLVGEDQALTTAFVEVVEPEGAAVADPASNIRVPDAAEMASALGRGQSVNVYGLLFDHDSAALKPASRPTLEAIAKLLDAQPKLRLRVAGHTDNQGGADYNRELSARRAQNVVDALATDFGIAPERLEASGLGYTEPVASNDTEEGRTKNRRVELSPLR